MMEEYDSSFKPLYGLDTRITKLKSGVEVKRKDIPEYFKDEFLIECINFYWKYKEFGFPYSGGWAEQLNIHMEIITLLTTLDKTYGNVKMTL